MTTLVEDLLLLARLDAGRPLEQSQVDLTRLAIDAVRDAHAAGPAHRWFLNVVSTEPGAARVSVVDQGPGIARDLLPRVFERHGAYVP